MNVEVSAEEGTALHCLGWWWACVCAGSAADGDDPIPPDVPILHYCANGATAIVTAAQLSALTGIAGRMPRE